MRVERLLGATANIFVGLPSVAPPSVAPPSVAPGLQPSSSSEDVGRDAGTTQQARYAIDPYAIARVNGPRQKSPTAETPERRNVKGACTYAVRETTRQK